MLEALGVVIHWHTVRTVPSTIELLKPSVPPIDVSLDTRTVDRRGLVIYRNRLGSHKVRFAPMVLYVQVVK